MINHLGLLNIFNLKWAKEKKHTTTTFNLKSKDFLKN